MGEGKGASEKKWARAYGLHQGQSGRNRPFCVAVTYIHSGKTAFHSGISDNIEIMRVSVCPGPEVL